MRADSSAQWYSPLEFTTPLSPAPPSAPSPTPPIATGDDFGSSPRNAASSAPLACDSDCSTYPPISDTEGKYYTKYYFFRKSLSANQSLVLVYVPLHDTVSYEAAVIIVVSGIVFQDDTLRRSLKENIYLCECSERLRVCREQDLGV